MRLGIAFCFVLVFALSASVHADYTLVGKIPAPRMPVTGLTTNGFELLVAADLDTASYMYLISPDDGEVYDSHRWAPPHQLDAAAYEGDYIYWVADAPTADFIRFEWVDGVVTPIDTVHNNRISYPQAMLYQPMGESMDALWIGDAEEDSLYLMAINGFMYEAYDLYGIAFLYNLGPSSMTASGGNLFLTSYTYTDSIYETTSDVQRVDAHLLSDLGEMNPLASTFHGGLLYVGGNNDSIFIYSTGSYADSVPEGENVVVEIVPEALKVGFDSVATAGSLYVEVTEMQPCPPPGGVVFFSEYYDVSTTAQLEYITHVMLMTDEPLPSGVNPRRVRVFVRSSGECTLWRDITVAETEIVPPQGGPELFRVNTRTLSEDDQFSMFVLGEDRRNPAAVINLKFDYLETAITENQDSIPEDTYNQILGLLSDAEAAFETRGHRRAARLVDRIANIVRADTGIPHRYDPQTGRVNVAGRIISRAHTLAFSLRSLIWEQQFGEPLPASRKEPDVDIVGESSSRFTLSPNPSRSSFTISLSGTGKQPVSVSIYSVEGELVRTLMDRTALKGRTALTWHGRNDLGLPVAAGTYFVVVREGDATAVKKLILQK
jgi:hypothetical protein